MYWPVAVDTNRTYLALRSLGSLSLWSLTDRGVFLADEISWSSHWLDAKIIPERQIFKWTDDNGKLDRHMNNMRNKLRDRHLDTDKTAESL